MPAFDYQALDHKGRSKSGVIAADSAQDARRRLQAGKLYATALSLSKSGTDKSVRNWLTYDRISKPEIALITRQMATMLEAGSPVEEALAAIADQTEKAASKRVLLRIRAAVMEGGRLSKALGQEPASFDPLYCSMVAAGEASGDLATVLARLADHREKSEETRNKIQAALLYPIMISIVAVGVVISMMVFVVPKVVAQFESYGQELPTLTYVVMTLSDFMVSYGLFLLIFIGLMVAGFSFMLRRPGFRYSVHSSMLKVPMIGRFIRLVNTSRFARAASTLLYGGSPLVDALKASQPTLVNSRMHNALKGVIVSVEEGGATSSAIKKSGEFMPLLAYMMAAGEKTGRMADMLGRVADYLDREFDDFSKKALGLLEPMIVVFMAVVVGLIVMAIMLPILQLNSLVLT